MTTLNVNGRQHNVDLPADTPLLWVLRDELGLTGTKFGCGIALCGACTVHVDGQPVRSCLTPISARRGQAGHRPSRPSARTRSARRCRPRGSSSACRSAATARRADHVRDGAAQAQAQAHRRRHRRRDERQHLPLRDVRAHPRRHQAGGGPARRRQHERAPRHPVPRWPIRRSTALGARQRQPAPISEGAPRSAGSCWPPASRRRCAPPTRRSTAPTACRTAGSTTRWCSSPSPRTASSDRVPPLRDGPGRAHGHADDRRRRAGSRLEARARGAGAPATRSATATRTPMARAARATSSIRCAAAAPPRAPCSKRRPPRAGACPSPRSRPRTTRSCIAPTGRRARLRVARQGRRRANPCPPGTRCGSRPGAIPLHRQGRAQAGRRPRHRDRQGAVRHRHPARRHALRGGGASAGVRREGHELRRHRGAQGAGRGARGRDRGEPRRLSSIRWAASPSSRANTWAAMQGRKALKIEWDDGPNAELRLGGFKATLEDAARKPGKVVRNDGDFTAAAAQRGEARRGAEYYVPHLAHATMEPPAATRAHRARQVRGLGLLPVPPGHARPGRQAPRHAGRRRDRARHAARRRVRAQVQARLRRRGGGALQGDGRQAGQGHLDARRRPAPRLLPHRLGRAPGGGPRRAGQPVAWLHRTAAPTMSTFDVDAKQEAPLELGMGVINVPFAIPNIRIENPEASRTRASAGSARSRTSPTRSRSSPSSPSSPPRRAATRRTFLLEVIGPARIVQSGALGDTLEPRRVAGALSGRHRPPAARRRDRGARSGLGPGVAEGPWTGHRRALQLRHLRGGGGGGRGRRQGRADDPPGGPGGGLRRVRQPGARPRADGRRVRHGRRRSPRWARSASRTGGRSRTTSTPTR